MRRQHFADVVLGRHRVEDERAVRRAEEARPDGVDRVNVDDAQRREGRQVSRARPELRHGAAVHRKLIGAAGQTRVAGQPVERRLGVIARPVHGRDRANDRVLVRESREPRHQFADLKSWDVRLDRFELAAILRGAVRFHVEHVGMRRAAAEPDADQVLCLRPDASRGRTGLSTEHIEHAHTAEPQPADAQEVPAVDPAEQITGVLHERTFRKCFSLTP